MAELREELDAYYVYSFEDGIYNTTFFGDDLERRLGPKRQDLSKVIPITVMYSIIFLAGVCGNVATCIVIVRNKYMHTATNYYLFNLAVADLLVLVLGLPIELYSFWSAYPWVFGELFCVARNMAAETATNAAILTITAFTIERYVAVCHPMRSHRMSRPGRAFRIIAVVWLVATLCSIPQAMQFGLVYVFDQNGNPIKESAQCNLKPGHRIKHTFELATFLFFFAPMAIITGLYGLMAMAIRRSTLSRSGSSSSEGDDACEPSKNSRQPRRRDRRAVIKMLVAVVVAFFVCWAPFHAQRLMILYVKKWSKELLYIQMILFYISGILYYISSTINPILYNIMSLKFRKAFKDTLLWSTCQESKRSPLTYTFKFTRAHVQSVSKSDSSECASPLSSHHSCASCQPKNTIVFARPLSQCPMGCVRVFDKSRHLPRQHEFSRPKFQKSRLDTALYLSRFPATSTSQMYCHHPKPTSLLRPCHFSS